MAQETCSRPSFWRSPLGLGLTVVAVAASIYLYVAHGSHLLAAMPYVVLLACPLMHLFMHRGHGHGGPAEAADDRRQDQGG